jgi:xanthine/CO dehydrogenase XdhC/CoxF family maturation factor
MRDVVRQLAAALRSGQPVAYCRLVETRGSTPQKAGAMMLVFPDGSQAGTLGGGCVEAEVKRRALTVLHERRAELIPFQLDSDYGWDDGLICGGRMQVLMLPLGDGAHSEYFARYSALIESGTGFTEAVVFGCQPAVGTDASGLGWSISFRDPQPPPAPGSAAASIRQSRCRLPSDPSPLPPRAGRRGTCGAGGRQAGCRPRLRRVGDR